jgi:photosystem II stability/assembly factor-like uncharacterized protein
MPVLYYLRMSRFRVDSGAFERLSPRQRRAVALGVLALVLTGAAGFAYLRANMTVRTPLSTAPASPTPAHAAPAGPNPVTYDFVSPSIGWAVDDLNTPTTPAGGFAVFKTTDGAKHWQKQLQLESSFVGFVPLSVQFIDQTHGFIAVGDPFELLNRTSDGGANWDSIPLPAGSHSVDGIGFSSSQYGWLLVGGLASTLYATNDAGTTWRRLPDPPSDATALRYRSPSEAWMGMGSTGLAPAPPHVYMSGDGGNTWTRVVLPPPLGTSWTGDHFIPAGVELLPHDGVVAFIPPVDQPVLVPFRRSLTSFDRGRTWQYRPAPPGAVAYQDAMHWWSMKGTSLFKSSDAGQSWVLVTNALPDLQYIPHVLDSKHAWALTIVVGGYGLALTSDGGLHWTQAAVPQPY